MNEQDADLSITMAIARGASPSKEQLAACSAAMAKKLLVENTIFFQVPKRDEPADPSSSENIATLLYELRSTYPFHADNIGHVFASVLPGDPDEAVDRLVQMRDTMSSAGEDALVGFYKRAIQLVNDAENDRRHRRRMGEVPPPVKLAEPAYLPGALVPVKLDDFQGVPYGRVEVRDVQRGRATVGCGNPDCPRTRTVALPLGTLDLGWEWRGGEFWCPDHGSVRDEPVDGITMKQDVNDPSIVHVTIPDLGAIETILGDRVAGVTHAPGDPPERVTFHLHEPASFVEMDVVPPSAPAPYVARCDVTGCTTEEPTNLPGEELPAGWGRGGALGPGALLCPRHAADRVMVWIFCVICGSRAMHPAGDGTLPANWQNSRDVGLLCAICSSLPRVHHLKARSEATCGLLLEGPSPDEDEGRDARGLKWTRFPSRATCGNCREELGFLSPRTEPLALIEDHRRTTVAVLCAFDQRHLWTEADLTDAVKRSRAHTRDALEDLAQIGEIDVVDDDGPTIWGKVVKVHLDEAVLTEPGCRHHDPDDPHASCAACTGGDDASEPSWGARIRTAAIELAIERTLRSFECPLHQGVVENEIHIQLRAIGEDLPRADRAAAFEHLCSVGKIERLTDGRWKLVTKPRRFEARATLRDALKLALGGKIRMVLLDDAPTWETVAPSPIEKEAQRLRIVRDACNWILDRIGGAK